MHKYETIYQSLLLQIQTGKLEAGSKLPSIRNLTQLYSCSKSTVLSALKRLVDQHIIYAVPKSGYYVVEHQIFKTPEPPEGIDFATASPSWHVFPYQDFQHCINKAIDAYQEDLFLYGTPTGLPTLITESKKLLESYQVFTPSDRIIITSGVQQALSLLSIMPFPNNRSTILVEQPSYHLYMDLLTAFKLPVKGIKRTAKGMDLNDLEKIFHEGDIKFFYTMPRFHNPLGSSYSKAEKRAVLKLAKKYDVYIIEDDYLADFEYNLKNDPLFAEDIDERVIYLKSFSKIMFPGLRIGIAVLPHELIHTFQLFKTATNIDSSMISQAALNLYLKSGMFTHYKTKVGNAYHNRAKILQQSVQTHLSMYEHSSEIVMHTHILLPKKVNIKLLISHLYQLHIFLGPVDRNYLDGFYHERILKINVSKVDEHQIDKGIKKIADSLKNPKNNFL